MRRLAGGLTNCQTRLTFLNRHLRAADIHLAAPDLCYHSRYWRAEENFGAVTQHQNIYVDAQSTEARST